MCDKVFDDGEWLFWRDLSSDEVEAKLQDGYDIIFLPVGSTEVHGRYLPLSTDTLIAEATCLLMARKHKGLVLPAIEYSWPGATGSQPGTIGIKQEVLAAFIRGILDDLFARGFNKIVIYSVHGPNAWLLTPLVREYYEETGRPVLFLTNLTSSEANSELRKLFDGYSPWYSEASRALAARKILGKPGPVDLSHIQKDELPYVAEERSSIRQFGWVGYLYDKKEEHMPLGPEINWKLGMEYLNKIIESQGDLRKALEEYILYCEEKIRRQNEEGMPLGYKKG